MSHFAHNVAQTPFVILWLGIMGVVYLLVQLGPAVTALWRWLSCRTGHHRETGS